MRLLPPPVMPTLPPYLPDLPLPAGVRSATELAEKTHHPQRGAWLAERLRRRDENRRVAERRRRLEQAAWDILQFGLTYLGHYFTDPPAQFHGELVGLLTEIDELEWFKTAPNPAFDVNNPDPCVPRL